MIGRSFRREEAGDDSDARGFDDYTLRLGDLMRGERATMGKSLLDVQRELKIKAAYIAAIENADPTAFDTPGFIAGYVRSYARYLGMDPNWAFETFCAESGFATAHGMSAEASAVRPSREERLASRENNDIFAAPSTPFVPARDAVFSRIEPGAVGSVLVLIALIGGLGYGGWTVLQEVQRVTFAPVEQTPTVVTDLAVDPLAGGGAVSDATTRTATVGEIGGFTPPAAPTPEALDRLYRPQALDTPVMVARDAPIASLDPSTFGALVPEPVEETVASERRFAEASPDRPADIPSVVQVTADPRPGVALVAVRPAWVRVSAADGSVIFESIMNAGDTYAVPLTEEPPTLRIGESGAVYFAVAGAHYGPVGPSGAVTSNVALSAENLTNTYEVADLTADSDLARTVAELQAAQ